MKRNILTVIFIVCACLGVYGQNTPIDLILLLNTSSSMSSSYNIVNEYLTGSFLSEYLRLGDTFHLIVFSGSPRLDSARRISEAGDVETIIGRLLLQYPVENGNNAEAAVTFAEQYITSLPARPKKIILVSTGSDINNLVTAARQRLSSSNTTIDFVQVTSGQPLANLPRSQRGGAVSQQRPSPGTTSATGTPSTSGTTSPAGTPSTSGTTSVTGTPPASGTPSTSGTTSVTGTPPASGTTPVTGTPPASGTTPATGTPPASGTTSVTGTPSTSGTTSVTETPQTSGTTSPAGTPPASGTTSPAGTPSTSGTTPATGTPPASGTTSPAGTPPASGTTETAPGSTELSSPSTTGSSGTERGQTVQETSSNNLQVTGIAFSFPVIAVIVILLLLLAGIIIFFASRGRGSGNKRAVKKDSLSKKDEEDDLSPFVDHSKELARYAAAQTKQRTNPYADRPLRTEKTKTPVIHPTGPLLLNLFVEDQNTNIGKRNIHSLKSGYSLSIGGKNSDFLIFLVSMPPNIAEIRRNGSQCTFIPKRPKYFPDLGSSELQDCINKNIRVVSDKKYEMRIRFEMYEDPLEALNRVLMSIKVPG